MLKMMWQPRPPGDDGIKVFDNDDQGTKLYFFLQIAQS